MTPRNVFFARRITAILAFVALLALVAFFASRACGALLGPGDEQLGSSSNAAQDGEPARKDDRSGGGISTERTSKVASPGDTETEDLQAREALTPSEADRGADAGAGVASRGTDDNPEDDAGDGTNLAGKREGEAVDAGAGLDEAQGGEQDPKKQNPEEPGFQNALADAQDDALIVPIPVSAATETVPVEVAPAGLAQNIAAADTVAADNTAVADAAAVTGAADRRTTYTEPAEIPPAVPVDTVPTATSAAAKNAAAARQERRLERRQAPSAAQQTARRNAGDAGDAPGAVASAVAAPAGNAPTRARDSDAHTDRTGATRGRANATTTATPGSSASARAAAYADSKGRARTATSAHSKAVLGKGQRRAEAAAYSSAYERTRASDGTISWSRSWSYHQSWATSSGG